MYQEEIAQLTGTLKFKVEARALNTFEKRLDMVEAKLRQFAQLTNKKLGVKVALDLKSFREQLARASAAKITLRNFAIDSTAAAQATKALQDRMSATPIRLKNVKVDISDLMQQKQFMKTAFRGAQLDLPVNLGLSRAQRELNAWKKATEAKFKLHLNADISRSKLMNNARETLRAVSGKLNALTVPQPKVKVSIDRVALRSEIQNVLAQIQREVKIKIDLTGRADVRGGGGGTRGGAGHVRAGMGMGIGSELAGWGRGFIPGLGGAFAIAQLNRANQELQGQRLAMQAVGGGVEGGQALQTTLRNISQNLGLDDRALGSSYVKMQAAGQASDFSKQQVDNIFASMAEYGRVMGLDGEAMKGSFRAVEQMMGKGQIMSEELKGQLAERFPAAVALMAKSQEMSVADLMKKMEKGELKSDALIAFARTLGEEARKGGALDAAMQGTAAQQGRFQFQWNRTIEAFASGGFDRAMSDFFRTASDGMKDATPLVEHLGKAFENLMRPVNALISIGGMLASTFGNVAKQMGLTSTQSAMLAVQTLALATPFGRLASGIAYAALALEDFMVFLQGGDSVFGDWLQNTPAAAEAFNGLAKSTRVMLDNMDGMITALAPLTEGLKGLQFSDVLISTMQELKAIIDAFNAVVGVFSAGKAYADAKAADGENGIISRNYNTIKGMVMGQEAVNDALQFRSDSIFAEALNTMTDPSSLQRSEGPSLSEEEYRFRYGGQSLGPVQTEARSWDVNLSIKVEGENLDGVSISPDLEDAFRNVAKRAFQEEIDTAMSNHKEDM